MPLRNPSPATFGTPPDYAEFEDDGTLVFYGEATTWKDELGPILASRLESPSSDIAQNLAEGTITFEATAVYPTDYVVFSLQLNHGWMLASAIKFHIHWWQASADVPNWLLGYRYQRNGAAKEASWTLVPVASHAFTYSAGILNQISGFGVITPPGAAGVSDIVQIRLYRDYTNVSTLFGGAESSGLDVEVMSGDIHRQSNTLGSRNEYVK